MSTFTSQRDRDAWNTIRGYVYQVDLTIERWLNLQSGQTLELECGEDIDIVSRSLTATPKERQRLLEQVKHRVSSITLKTSEVVTAIACFMEHRQTNPSANLLFRFTTNTQVGKEKLSPMPNRGSAIVAWEDIRQGNLQGIAQNAALQGIRTILKNVKQPDKLHDDSWQIFCNFITNASNDRLLDLICSFEWSTKAPDAQSLSPSLQKLLIERKHARDNIEAQEQYRRLFLYVFKLLCEPGIKQLTVEERSHQLSLPTLSETDHQLLNNVVLWVQALEVRVQEHEVRLGVLEQRLDREQAEPYIGQEVADCVENLLRDYLEALCNAYTQWWKFGTLKDVVEPKQVESEPSTLPFEFDLMVQTVERDAQQRSQEEQKVERLSVLEGLQKYAPNHVLLVGRPGSGKSTALVRLLVATAQQALQNPHSPIPVLVELRTYKIYYKTSVLDLVQASLKRRKLRLNLEMIEDLLAQGPQGRFLLLMDGINELPDDEARRTIKEFRRDYSDVPMVFTTRDLGVGGDLGIQRKLEMQSLTEAEVEKFVRECLPGGSEERLQQLRQRLRELGQTPFVMWMLYFIVQKTGTVPSGAGSAFREFTQLYERRSKDDAPVSDESRRWWNRLLEHLGFEMMQAQKPTDFRLTISKREAEDILTKFLDSEKFDKPRDYALQWLEDLLKHHLIQVTSNDQIEFCHQLIQEYYAAEILVQMLLQEPSPLSDETLKREYLNYLKWTEPLALMLELVEDETQAVRVVKLALKVDLRLGARLAGAVKPKWQEQTVGLVVEREIPQLLKIELLGVTRSCKSIPTIRQALEEKDWIIRWIATRALGKIGSEATVPALAQAVNDEESSVRWQAIEALEKVGTEGIVPALSQAVNDEEPSIRLQVVNALETVGNDSAISTLLNAWTDENPEIRFRTLSVLGQISGKDKISTLIQYLTERGFEVQSTLYSSYLRDEIFPWSRQKPQPIAYVYSPLDALEKIGESPTIHTLCQALVDENPSVRRSVVYRLRQFDSELTIPLLLQALQDEDSHVCLNAFSALKEIGVPGVLPYLYERILIATSPIFLDELFEVASAIQQRCKFYNYTVATSPPPQDESKVEHLAAPIDMQ